MKGAFYVANVSSICKTYHQDALVLQMVARVFLCGYLEALNFGVHCCVRANSGISCDCCSYFRSKDDILIPEFPASPAMI